MATATINNAEAVSTTAEEDTLKSALTPDENSGDSHQNNGCSTPDPPAAVKEVPLRRSNRGKGRPDRSNHGDERLQSCLWGSVEYKPGDYVYYEEADADYYAVGLIDEIKMSRREKCSLIVKSFWRTGDVPEVSKQALLDREDTDSGDPRVLARELFVTEHQSTIYSSLLRGKCSVVQLPDLRTALKTFDSEVEDSFFYVYAYNPETKRLLSTRAEIKIGPAYQATWLPPCRGLRPLTHRCAKHNSLLKRLRETQNTATPCPHSPPPKRPKTSECCCNDGDTGHCEHVCLQRVDESPPKQWEQLVWLPDGLRGVQDEGSTDNEFADRPLKTYLDAVRSLVAIFAFGGSDDDLVSAENGHVLANLAVTTQHAYDTLHACDYNLVKAIEAVKANPIVSTDTPQHWTADQVRRFYKAIKVHGKNFHAIHRDFFASTTAMDPIGGDGGGDPAPRGGPRGRKRRGHHHSLESKRTLTSAASVPTSLFSLARDTPNSNLAESEVEEVSRVENAKLEETEDVSEPGRIGYEVKLAPPDDVKREDKDREDKSSACSTRAIFQPTREKTVKQLITFYYYWKRKGFLAMSSLSSNSNNHRNRNTFRGSSVVANFNRCYSSGKKRKQIGTRAGIMA